MKEAAARRRKPRSPRLSSYGVRAEQRLAREQALDNIEEAHQSNHRTGPRRYRTDFCAEGHRCAFWPKDAEPWWYWLDHHQVDLPEDL
jgi:hypothetical protein